MRATTTTAILILLTGLTGCGSSSGGGAAGSSALGGSTAAGSTAQVSFANLAGGSTSGYATASGSRELLVIDNAADWQLFWASHGSNRVPAPATPLIDFSRENVLAAVSGSKPSGGYGIEIKSIEEDANGDWTVLFAETAPAPGAIVTMALTNPFHFVKTPKANGQVTWSTNPSMFVVTDEHGVYQVQGGKDVLVDDRGVSFEIVDARDLLVAGAKPGTSLSYSGDVRSQVLEITAFELDDFAASGRFSAGVFTTLSGKSFGVTGLKIPALQQVRTGAPLWVTGVLGSNPDLRVSSFRVERRFSYTLAGGMVGLRESFSVDLDSGAFTYSRSMVRVPQNDKAFNKTLSAAQLKLLRAYVDAANVHGLPKKYVPQFLIMDAPLPKIALDDAAKASLTEIPAGASPPQVVTHLMQHSRDLIEALILQHAP